MRDRREREREREREWGGGGGGGGGEQVCVHTFRPIIVPFNPWSAGKSRLPQLVGAYEMRARTNER